MGASLGELVVIIAAVGCELVVAVCCWFVVAVGVLSTWVIVAVRVEPEASSIVRVSVVRAADAAFSSSCCCAIVHGRTSSAGRRWKAFML